MGLAAELVAQLCHFPLQFAGLLRVWVFILHERTVLPPFSRQLIPKLGGIFEILPVLWGFVIEVAAVLPATAIAVVVAAAGTPSPGTGPGYPCHQARCRHQCQYNHRFSHHFRPPVKNLFAVWTFVLWTLDDAMHVPEYFALT
jgi:hypothetical protein